MAILADPAEKRRLHGRDAAKAFSAGNCFETRELMAMTCCPLDASRATFYGQSVSLAEYLVGIGGEHRFVQFLQNALESGYDRALAEQYGIGSVRELHNDWLKHQAKLPEASPGSEEPALTLVSAGGRPAVAQTGQPAGSSLGTKHRAD
jgi:hypothetical protein